MCKARVDGLCAELAGLARQTPTPQPTGGQSQSQSQGGFAGGFPGGLSGSGGGEAQELPLHRIDIGKICRDELVAATLAGQQMKAAARESACTAPRL